MSAPETTVSRYSEETIKRVFRPDFQPLRSFEEEHTTPFHTTQFFLWTIFKKISSVEVPHLLSRECVCSLDKA